MFHNLQDALYYIEHQRYKRSFDDFKAIVKKYHFNTKQRNMIHIAGTNGKGSTTKLTAKLLMNHGYQVGTFTSPYIEKHNDRICINEQPVSDDDLLSLINELYEIIEVEQLSMFEIDVLLMLRYFDRQDLDFRIIETGIGGRYDKTNVIDSVLSAITNIGYDHQFMLGDTLEEIAYHKAGIIKANQVFITTEANEEILDIFYDCCDEVNAFMYPLIIQEKFPEVYYDNHLYTLKQGGSYQVYNATLALAIVSNFIHVDSNIVQKTFDDFTMPGRFERFLIANTNIYLDGAHNIDGIKALIKCIEDNQIKDPLILFSSLADKDETSMLKLLQDYEVLLVAFEDERYQNDQQVKNYQEVLAEYFNQDRNIILTGSLHFISDVRKYLINKKAV